MFVTRVCCFCETWGSGGIESFLVNAFRRMEFENLEIDIVASRLLSDVHLNDLQRMGINFFLLSGSTRRVLANGRILSRLQRERSYDVIHMNIFHALSLYYLLLMKRTGVARRIVHCHGSGLRPSATRLLKLGIHRIASRLWCRFATDWWACSSTAAKFMYPSHIASKAKVVTEGISAADFGYDAEVRGKMRRMLGMSDKFVVGQVGRLSGEKNQSFTFDVFSVLFQKDTRARLLLVGEGEDREMLELKAASLGIADAVTFLGYTNAVHKLMQAMDVLIVPSLFEGFGIVAIEAQASGLPVVCSEAVPPETNISGRLKYMPLKAGKKAWAEQLLALRGLERRDGSAMAVRAGCDSSATAQWMRRYYVGGGL